MSLTGQACDLARPPASPSYTCRCDRAKMQVNNSSWPSQGLTLFLKLTQAARHLCNYLANNLASLVTHRLVGTVPTSWPRMGAEVVLLVVRSCAHSLAYLSRTRRGGTAAKCQSLTALFKKDIYWTPDAIPSCFHIRLVLQHGASIGSCAVQRCYF